MRNRIVGGAFACLLAFCLIALILGTVDSPRTNVRYRLWKAGIIDYQPDLSLRLFMYDPSFRNSLHGKELKDLSKLFPNLVHPDNGNEYQRDHHWYTKDKEFRWIGDSSWGFEFEGERVVDVVQLKG